MSILTNIKNVKKQQKEKERLEKIEEKKANDEYKKHKLLIKSNNDKVWDALKELNDSKDFKIERSTGDNFHSSIGLISQYISFGKGHPRGLHSIGNVCFSTHRYKFRGADDQPEQDCSDNVLALKNYVNSEDSIISVDIDEYDISEGLIKFQEQLAEYLAQQI